MRDPLPRVQRGLAAALRDRRTQLSAAAFVLTALACYLYVLVGNINNYDNIVCTPEGYGTGLRSGRWMLTLLGDTVGHAMGNFNLPLFNGLFGLVFLGLACQFLWRALHLQKPWQCAVLTAITAGMARRGLGHAVFLHRTLLPLRRPAGGRGRLDGGPARLGLVRRRVADARLLHRCLSGLFPPCRRPACAAPAAAVPRQRDSVEDRRPARAALCRRARGGNGRVFPAAAAVPAALSRDAHGLPRHQQHGQAEFCRAAADARALRALLLPAAEDRLCLPDEFAAHPLAMWASLLLSAVSLALAWRDRDWKKIVTVVLLLAALPIAANGIFIMAPETATHTLMTYGVVTLFYLPLIVGDGLRWRRDAVRRVGQPADLPVSCRCVGRVCMVLQRLLPHELLFQ